MENYKKAQVVMLPHNNIETKITLYKDNDGEPLELSLNLDKLQYHTNQHLYIISDDEIKEGDWVIDSGGIIRKVERINEEGRLHLTNLFALTILAKSCKKIIAATDTLLKINEYHNFRSCCRSKEECYCSLPQPSQQFITKYIEEYNKDSIIKEIMVEYEEY